MFVDVVFDLCDLSRPNQTPKIIFYNIFVHLIFTPRLLSNAVCGMITRLKAGQQHLLIPALTIEVQRTR